MPKELDARSVGSVSRSKREGHAGAWPSGCAVRLGLVLDPAGSGEFLRLEALTAEHGASLRWTEGHRRFLPACRTVGRRFHALAADAAATAARRARGALGL